jgi:hypothetical protein
MILLGAIRQEVVIDPEEEPGCLVTDGGTLVFLVGSGMQDCTAFGLSVV